MYIRFWLISLILVIASSYSVAQNDFRKGYIVEKSGEVVTGFINFKSNSSNAKQCFFKADSLGKVVSYNPFDITAYRFTDGKYYVSKKVADGDLTVDVFLECLISGKATIYYCERENADHFYIEKDGHLKEIHNKSRNIRTKGFDAGVMETNQYKGVLKYCFQDCPEILPKVDNAPLDKKTLIKLSKEYHERVCKDEACIIYEKQFRKHVFQIGFDVSYAPLGNLRYKNNDFDFNARSTFQFAANVLGQVNLDEDNRYFLQLSLGYFINKVELLNVDKISLFILPPYNIRYEYSLFRPALSLKYKLRMGKFYPFCSLGFYTGFQLTDKGTLTDKAGKNKVEFDKGGVGFDLYFSPNKIFYGGIGELGFDYKFLSLKRNAAFSIFIDKSTSTTTFRSFGVGIKNGFYF
jgi:hypothetical protein